MNFHGINGLQLLKATEPGSLFSISFLRGIKFDLSEKVAAMNKICWTVIYCCHPTYAWFCFIGVNCEGFAQLASWDILHGLALLTQWMKSCGFRWAPRLLFWHSFSLISQRSCSILLVKRIQTRKRRLDSSWRLKLLHCPHFSFIQLFLYCTVRSSGNSQYCLWTVLGIIKLVGYKIEIWINSNYLWLLKR